GSSDGSARSRSRARRPGTPGLRPGRALRVPRPAPARPVRNRRAARDRSLELQQVLQLLAGVAADGVLDLLLDLLLHRGGRRRLRELAEVGEAAAPGDLAAAADRNRIAA